MLSVGLCKHVEQQKIVVCSHVIRRPLVVGYSGDRRPGGGVDLARLTG